jgi:XTP/dITP diphosphohydrolase
MAGLKFVLATANMGKFKEFEDLLTGFPCEMLSMNDFDIDSPEETGTTFIENAIIKARYASTRSGLPVIADDSGIVIDYLKGEPGVHSARYAGDNRDATDCNHKVLQLLEGVPEEKRGAHFHCTLAYIRHANDPDPVICQGRWYGSILTQMVGDQGFGYDPIFYVPEKDCSAGELSWQDKNWISHRGQAMKLLLMALTKELQDERN